MTRNWIGRLGLMIYAFLLVWICSYLYWTLLPLGVSQPGWIGRFSAFAGLIGLVFFGSLFGLIRGNSFQAKFLVVFLFCALTILTYAGTSFTIHDSVANKSYTVLSGFLVAESSTCSPPPPSRFQVHTDRNEKLQDLKRHVSDFQFNLWIPVVAIATLLFLPELLGRVRLALRWQHIGQRCGKCGYNLTGLTESRCPECGTGFS